MFGRRRNEGSGLRNFKRDIEKLDGTPLSEVDEDLAPIARILKNE